MTALLAVGHEASRRWNLAHDRPSSCCAPVVSSGRRGYGSASRRSRGPLAVVGKSIHRELQPLCPGRELRLPRVLLRRPSLSQAPPIAGAAPLAAEDMAHGPPAIVAESSRAPVALPRSGAPTSTGATPQGITDAGSAHRRCFPAGRRGHGPPAMVGILAVAKSSVTGAVAVGRREKRAVGPTERIK